MAKSSSPVRLEAELMQAAAVNGQLHHRSAAEQIEYWASLGRSIAQSVDPDKLLAVTTGLARINIEPVLAPEIDADSVFKKLESDRQSGELSKSLKVRVAANSFSYQASSDFPGKLEQLDSEGNIRIGIFSNGKFIAEDIH